MKEKETIPNQLDGGQYCSISNSHKGSTKRKFQTDVSHKFGIKFSLSYI